MAARPPLKMRDICTILNGQEEASGSGLIRVVAPSLTSSQKFQKSSKSLLTPRGGGDYIRLTNDGGDAASEDEVRF